MDARAFVESAIEYIREGGHVMGPLVLMAFGLWYALGYRLLLLRRGTTQRVEPLLARFRRALPGRTFGIIDTAAARAVTVAEMRPAALSERLDLALSGERDRMKKFAVMARVIVAVAPLAGLLGTVSGMIEMFDSLGDSNLYSQDGGIAQGIAEALFTTQMGLAIAIPGMIVARLLDRRAGRLGAELDQIKDLCIAGHGPAEVAA